MEGFKTMLEKILYSKKQAAQTLAISPRSIDHLASRGIIQFTRIGGRSLVHRDELERLARTGSQQHITR
jgi:excisionase family DNA binding protein